jgi:uncharacterized protein (DUF2336 family)
MGPDGRLNSEDVKKLLENPSADARVEILQKITPDFNEHKFSDQQMKLAEQIFRTLLHDAEVLVRQSLAENLKDNPDVPHDIILSLAKDVDEVALPVLQFSKVLTDEDLLEIINSTSSSARLVAISNRDAVSEKVTDALVETKDPQVVSNLLGRMSAKFSEIGLNRVFDIFSEDKDVTDRLIRREELPVSLTEKMVLIASDNIKAAVLSRYEKKHPHLKKIFEQSKESATIKFMGFTSEEDIKKLVSELDQSGSIAQELHSSSEKVVRIIEHLEDEGRLSPISALCMGHLQLFEVSIARVSKVPLANVRKLIHLGAEEAFNALYKRANLPPEIYDAVWLVVRVLKEMEHEHPNTKRQPAKDIINRLLIRSESEKKEIENLSYFISMIHQHAKLSAQG